MARAAARARRHSGRARPALRERLEARREEIEAAALTRVNAIADPSEVGDSTYAGGLRAAVAAAVAYGIETTGREGADPPVPVSLLAQARMAARVGIPLDTVLRRYFAGYSLLGYYILEEASNAGIADGVELKRLLGTHAGIFDRLLAAIGEEHARESEALTLATGEHRRVERIERLLSGEPADTAAIPYSFEGQHVGYVAAGPAAEQAVRRLAAKLDCRLLCVPREDGPVWAWLGSRRPLDPGELLRQLASVRGGGEVALALGEPAEGLAGWRRTHRQAAAALPVATSGPEKTVRYAEVALLAAVLRDDLLADSLRERYLTPLDGERDGGVALRETIWAYLANGGSLTSVATVLKVSPRTVGNRLRRVEEILHRPLQMAIGEIEIALRLERLDRSAPAS